ncbi:MAG: HlyD family type I secretion periplasmic adaptor subunit [Alphaproteobacteria bacterium]
MIGSLKSRVRRTAPHEGRDEAVSVPLATMGLKGTVTFGFVLIGMFFGIFGIWAAWADLETAAIASGQVMVGSNRKVVQHLEGGIVRQIRVHEGARVEAGAPLVELQEAQPETTLEMVRVRLRHAAAREARLMAERDGLDTLSFPDWLRADAGRQPEIGEIVDAQTRIFASRRNSIDSQTSILRQRVAQYREEIAGLRAEIRSETTQLGLIADEVKDVEYLVGRGLERRSRLLQLRRQASAIEGSRARNRALVARAEQSIGETELRILDLTTSLNREINEELREVQAEVADLWERHRAAEDVMTRTVIRAPVAGTVVNLKVFTAGGVIAPREPLMEIVPADDELIVEARVDPSNIDMVHAGLRANVRFTAFSARNVETIEGRVERVSADALVDDRTGISFYSARIVFSEEERARLRGLELYPGMPAEVMIVAGQRTALSYLVRPLTTSFGRAMRED